VARSPSLSGCLHLLQDDPTDPAILKDLVVIRDRMQAAVDLIEELTNESRPAARSMRVFELL